MTQESEKCVYRIPGEVCGYPAAFTIALESGPVPYCFTHHELVLELLRRSVKGFEIVTIPVRQE